MVHATYYPKFSFTTVQVTVQGSFSVLSFYNAHSGGKMSSVPLNNAVVGAQFSKDGDKIVAVFRVNPPSYSSGKLILPLHRTGL